MSKMEMSTSITGPKCEYCGGNEFIRDRDVGEVVCTACGCVAMKKNIEKGPEWRSFEGDERLRVGLPPSFLLQDKGLSTLIGKDEEDEDSRGTKIALKDKKDLKRLRKWQRRVSISAQQRNLSHALEELNDIGKKLDIPRDALENAAYIYRLALERDMVSGRAIKSVVSAALYASLRYYKIPRTIKELAKTAEIDNKELARNYRMLVKELRMKMPVVDSINYVRRISSRGGLDKRVKLEAEKIIRIAQKRKITAGKDPIGLAAAAVYYACVLLDVEKTQRDIAKAADVTELTVRNRYKNLSERIKLEKLVAASGQAAPIPIAEMRRYETHGLKTDGGTDLRALGKVLYL